jgi:hypothetical protein
LENWARTLPTRSTEKVAIKLAKLAETALAEIWKIDKLMG